MGDTQEENKDRKWETEMGTSPPLPFLSTHLPLLFGDESKKERWKDLVNQSGESSAALFLQLKFSSGPWCRAGVSRSEERKDRRPLGMPLT